jgi:hypothetical protein
VVGLMFSTFAQRACDAGTKKNEDVHMDMSLVFWNHAESEVGMVV